MYTHNFVINKIGLQLGVLVPTNQLKIRAGVL